MAFNIGILVVSDTCAKTPSLDRTGPAMKSYFEGVSAQSSEDESYNVTKMDVVADSVQEIQRVITMWAADSQDIRLIVTCGGTGFTQHDVTPEAVSAIITRQAPGIVHAMLYESLKKTPFAIMSRPVAGVINKSLVITLPGSPRGATENMDAVISTLSHALAQLGNKDSRALHQKKMRILHDDKPGSGHDHHHHHHHGIAKHKLISNDLDGPITRRARESPFEMISVEEAFTRISKETPAPQIVDMELSNPQILGSVVAEDVLSAIDVPSFPASIVDGYAVVSTDGPGKYPVVSASVASAVNKRRTLTSGEIERITTGAPVPAGADAVVMVEETELVSTQQIDGEEEENEVQVLAAAVKKGDNIRQVGSDLKKGSLVLQKGHVIRNGGEVGLLASIGVNTVRVYRKPKIGVLSTGDELEDASKNGSLPYGAIFDSNRPTLITTARSLGFECVDLGIVSDTKGTLREAMEDAFAKSGVDYLVTSGGVSMGEKDLLKPTIEQALGGQIHFGRVRMKPGKPTTFATVGQDSKRCIFALPGNPASAIVAFYLFVLPSLRIFHGYSGLPHLPTVKARLAASFRLDASRPEYQRVHLSQNEQGELVAESTGFQRSSRIASFKNANALLCLPAGSDYGSNTMETGGVVDAMVFAEIGR